MKNLSQNGYGFLANTIAADAADLWVFTDSIDAADAAEVEVADGGRPGFHIYVGGHADACDDFRIPLGLTSNGSKAHRKLMNEFKEDP